MTETLTGGCYCGAIRYESGPPEVFAQCHCRPCSHFSGGGPNYFLMVAPDTFRYVKGQPKQYSKTELENARTRDFCANCGTHLVTHRPGLDKVILKAGSLDDPDQAGQPSFAIFCAEKAAFHTIPDGMTAFDKLPPTR